ISIIVQMVKEDARARPSWPSSPSVANFPPTFPGSTRREASAENTSASLTDSGTAGAAPAGPPHLTVSWLKLALEIRALSVSQAALADAAASADPPACA